MMKLNRWFIAVAAAAMCLGTCKLSAQNDTQPADQQGGPGGPGRRNFDPAQMQQRMMDRTKEQLEITDDGEWKAIQPLVQKVMDLRRDTFAGMGRGMFGRPPRGGDNAPQATPNRRGGMFGTPMPEAEALQKAIDGKASNAEMKAAIAKYHEARKAKLAELEKAQDDLRKVLSVRQEALATLNGLL
jgi:hypothetical protein